MPVRSRLLLLSLLLLATGCATLQGALQPLRFTEAEGRTSELRYVPPTRDRPFGAAAVRLWARVENPNPFGLTLSRLAGDLFLQGTRAARVDFPLGMPLSASQDTVIPLDIVVDLSELPGLRDVLARAVTGRPVDYRLAGSFTVDAGALGQPSFGPTTLMQGEVETRR